MKIEYRPQGVCCQLMHVEIDDNKNTVIDAQFYGGCNGNLQGISSLIKGMNIDDVISKLNGISCGGKDTSCPDQLTQCLLEYKKYKEENK